MDRVTLLTDLTSPDVLDGDKIRLVADHGPEALRPGAARLVARIESHSSHIDGQVRRLLEDGFPCQTGDTYGEDAWNADRIARTEIADDVEQTAAEAQRIIGEAVRQLAAPGWIVELRQADDAAAILRILIATGDESLAEQAEGCEHARRILIALQGSSTTERLGTEHFVLGALKNLEAAARRLKHEALKPFTSDAPAPVGGK
jgi:hypothetical protein